MPSYKFLAFGGSPNREKEMDLVLKSKIAVNRSLFSGESPKRIAERFNLTQKNYCYKTEIDRTHKYANSEIDEYLNTP